MTREQKDILLKDLCARLPHKVKASYYGVEEECECIDVIDTIYLNSTTPEIGIGQYGLPIEKVKPYLFPLSSMTEEQKEEFYDVVCWETSIGFNVDESCNQDVFLEKIDWLNKNHFDYRGLIEKGLAIDATNLNIY